MLVQQAAKPEIGILTPAMRSRCHGTAWVEVTTGLLIRASGASRTPHSCRERRARGDCNASFDVFLGE
jgi:hypothetical protein